VSVELNHTIVWVTNKEESAVWLAEILGLRVDHPNGPFVPLQLANGVTLDFADAENVCGQHYAFLVSDETFAAALSRLKSGGLAYFADPMHQRPNEINRDFGGQGLYFEDADGHNMEILTRT
jgi:catechol 2,3-dioxygenase-like lactoylglutathione lyase family enzyme